MPKFFVPENQIEKEIITILGEDVNHIKNVLRLQREDEIIICSLSTSLNYLCKIQEIQDTKIICDIEKQVMKQSESNIHVDIFQGIPKFDKMESIIQKCTEIGVKEFTPVCMKRCVVKIEPKEEKKKLERWQKIAEVAAKQSGRDQIPIVHPVVKIKNIFDLLVKYDIVLVAYEQEKANTLKKQLQLLKIVENPKIAVVIGPEGGLEEQEIQQLRQHHAKIVTLGNRILRTETAPIVMAANILYELEE